MQKYILVKLLENVQIGSEFSVADWPLHLTLVDDFFADLDEASMRQKLSVLLASQPSVEAPATKDDLLGPLKTIPVTLLELTPGLLSLHNKLVDLLKQNGAALVSPEFAGNGFRPHVTIQGKHRIVAGDKIVIDTISLIAMSPDGRTHLKLLDTIKLSEA